MKYRVGVDIGGTSIKAGVVDPSFRIVKRISIKTPDTFAKAMKAIAEMVEELAKQMGLSVNEFLCVGCGTPCSVIPETGRLVFANNTNWKDVSIRDELSRYLSLPLYFGNDANCENLLFRTPFTYYP